MDKSQLLKMLLQNAYAKRFKAQEPIVQEGALANEGIGFLLAGGAKVTKRQAERDIPIGNIKVGHFFGETALLLERPRTATITATTDDTVVIFLSSHSFQSLAASHFQILELLVQEAADRIESIISTLIRLNLRQPVSQDASLEPIIAENRQKILEIQAQTSNTRSFWVGKSRPLFAQGDRDNGLIYIVVQGSLQAVHKYETGTYPLFYLEPGDIISYSRATSNPYKRFTILPAKGDSARVISFENDLFFRILRINKELFFYYFRSLVGQMVILDDTLRLTASEQVSLPGQAQTESDILAGFDQAAESDNPEANPEAKPEAKLANPEIAVQPRPEPPAPAGT